MLKKLFLKILNQDTELPTVIEFIKRYANKNSLILDVGCGYGRLMTPLQSAGYQVMGIEKNQHIVDEMNGKGFKCIQADDFDGLNTPAQMIILSHIIEHFTPSDLFDFLNKCITKLDDGGYLVIATPLYSQYFYDDFDHVKPYHPAGIQMVYGGKGAQVQYYSPHKLELKTLWFRRNAFFNTLRRSSYLKTPMRRVYQILDLSMAILFKVSFGLIGRKDGWVGVFQKC